MTEEKAKEIKLLIIKHNLSITYDKETGMASFQIGGFTITPSDINLKQIVES